MYSEYIVIAKARLRAMLLDVWSLEVRAEVVAEPGRFEASDPLYRSCSEQMPCHVFVCIGPRCTSCQQFMKQADAAWAGR